MTPQSVRIRPEPRYSQVAAALRAAIAGGVYGDGASLPTESVLCATYAISRFTAREALRLLQVEGLIRRQHGSGTTVVGGSPVLRQSLSDVAELSHYAAGSIFAFREHGLQMLPAARAAALRLPPGSRWVLLSGVRTIAGLPAPIAITEVFVHADLEPFVSALRAGRETLFTQLARLGSFHIARIEQDIAAIGASTRDAAMLQIARRTPCLRIRRTYQDASGRIALLSLSTHPGERFTYSMHIDN